MNADTRNAELAHDLLLAGASSSLHLALNQVLLGNNFNVLAKHTGRSHDLLLLAVTACWLLVAPTIVQHKLWGGACKCVRKEACM
jgi:hypothetical protein